MQHSFLGREVNPEQSTKILDYLNGASDMEHIGITRENGREHLTIIKKIDLAIAELVKSNGCRLNFGRTTYDLRTHILRLCSPSMQTAEAYTKAADCDKITHYTYLKNHEVWISERVGIHAKLIANQYALVVALSKRLKPGECEVSAIRGGTGVGKSRHLTKRFSYALDSNGELSGCLSPDVIKAAIKQQSISCYGLHLVNTQVYAEATALFALFQQAVSSQALRLSIVTDTRLISMEYFESSVIGPAQLRKGSALLLDVDAPLEASILRVLTRDPYGKDPCVPLQAVIDGFVEIRANRGVFIDRIQADSTIKTYKLYCTDEKGQKVLAAKKTKNAFAVLNKEILINSLKKPSTQAIKQTIKTIITPELIERAIAAKMVSQSKRKCLERWNGKTLAHAMARHVRGVVASTSEIAFLPDTIVCLRQLKYRSLWGNRSIANIEDRHFCPFFQAAKKGDVPALESILDDTDNVNDADLYTGPMLDAMIIASIMGHADIVNLLLDRGVDPSPSNSFSFNTFKNADEERMTPMGHAIENKHMSVVQVLLNHGVTLDQISREKTEITPLDLFFSNHKSSGPHPLFLEQLLSAGATVHNLNHRTIFAIGIYASSEELKILLKAGFDPNKDPFLYGTNVMELALMVAERANLLKYDHDVIQKVKALAEYGEDPFRFQIGVDQSYLHLTTLPDLIKDFCGSGTKPTWYASVQPIELAADEETIDYLCSIGQDPEKAPYLKGTAAHKEALQRIGFQHSLNKNWDNAGDLLLVKAVKNQDFSAFLALLGEGVDVNCSAKNGWTCLHYLFALLGSGSVSTENDYIRLAKDSKTRFIHLLIQHGARPLKDKLGRTPLACLDYNALHRLYNQGIIDCYSAFEADYYKTDTQEYRQKLLRLREDGLLYNGMEVLPTPGNVQEFWKSIENHTEFIPLRRFKEVDNQNKVIDDWWVR
jgi:ankyrin repeat protein